MKAVKVKMLVLLTSLSQGALADYTVCIAPSYGYGQYSYTVNNAGAISLQSTEYSTYTSFYIQTTVPVAVRQMYLQELQAAARENLAVSITGNPISGSKKVTVTSISRKGERCNRM
jgi:hypothetical protein